jgi:hypothetical protein
MHHDLTSYEVYGNSTWISAMLGKRVSWGIYAFEELCAEERLLFHRHKEFLETIEVREMPRLKIKSRLT